MLVVGDPMGLAELLDRNSQVGNLNDSIEFAVVVTQDGRGSNPCLVGQ
jgi:hypothetical protein